MMRGLYDIEVRPGSFQEMALIFREMREKQAQYRSSVLSMGERLEDPEDLIEELRDELLPGLAEREKRTMEKKAKYLRSLQDVDWSEEFSLDPDVLRRRQSEEKAEEALGPVASS